MRVRRAACDARRLEAFLRGGLPPAGQADVEAHLQLCEACRGKLDELAGGPPWWSAVKRYLGGDGGSALSRTSDDSGVSGPADAALDFLDPPTKPGTLGRLGNYEVLEVLGRGGMGLVLRAFDPALHRPVAIKVLAAAYAANGTARQRFAREARAAAAVVHDHVVPVHAVDADAPRPYLVMTFVPGRSLQERIDATGPLGLAEALRIAAQTASGLAAAHAQGIVHRDIKPANIMLENGVERVRITDFGLARAVDDASVTYNGAVAGTPQYMAPEQARGDPVDQRADLFSLGSTLYATCTGHAPFRGESAVAVLRLVCDGEPPPLRSVNASAPAWLEGIVRKLHAKDPAARFQSAAEVAGLLERCLAHVQQPDRQPLPPEAVDLGRRVGGATPRRVPWKWVAAVVVGVGVASLPWLVPARPTATATPVNAAALEEQWGTAQDRLRARLDALRHGLGPTDAVTGTASHTATLRQRLDGLRSGLRYEPAADAAAMDQTLTELRSRLERLRRQLGPGPGGH
jgi:hypothetical protein